LTQGTSIFSAVSVPLLELVGGIPYNYKLSGESLILVEEIYDGYTHEYVRK